MNNHFPQKVVTSSQFYKKNTQAGWATALLMALGFQTAHAQIQFTDVSAASGISMQTESYGASWGDLNGDGYPDLFANNHRMQCSLFLNKGDGSFLETGSQVYTWIQHQNADTHGGSWSDFDNDGDQDLLITTGTGNPSQFLVNEHGALIDRTDQYGITFSNVGGRLPVWFDYTGDHLPDFVLTQFGGAAKVFKQVPSEVTPSGTTFVDTTTAVKMLCKRFHYGQLFDVNGDGRLDFICGGAAGTVVFPQKIYNTLPLPWEKLFDFTAPSPVFPIVEQVVDSVIGDFNNDGRMDMFVLGGVQLHPSSVVQGGTNDFEAKLSGGIKGFNFVSNGMTTFNLDWKTVNEGTGVGFAKIQIGASAWNPTAMTFTLDSSNPAVAGMPPAPATADLPVIQIGYDTANMRWTLIHTTARSGSANSEVYFQVSGTAPITSLKSTGLWPSDKPASPTLLINYSGGYSDETVAAGLSTPVQCVSATAGDFDNDMDVDLYLVCRSGASNIENILYDNQGNGTFTAVVSAGGAGGPVGTAIGSGAGTGESVVSADYDVDGFLDLYVTNGLNLEPKYYGGPTKLFHNRGNANHWIELDLIGTGSERDAIGARVMATANGITQLRVKNGGYHRWSQDAVRSHFGLAVSKAVDIRVEWPSGTVTTYPGVVADRLYRITEGTGIAPVALGIAPPYPCGPPAFNGAIDANVFVWKECLTGAWKIKTTAGGGSVTYSGTITSSAPFTAVTPVGFDTGDSMDSTSNPKQIVYQLVTTGNGSDGINFTPQEGATTCLKVSAPSSAKVLYGPLRAPVTQSFNLDTLAPC